MIGVDIEDISRFENKDDEFFRRIFTDLEIDYCLKFKNPAPHFAARFCAKEAVFKALSSYGVSNIVISQIEIYNDEKSCPRVRFIDNSIPYRVNISLSHEKEKAIAFAMLCVEDLEKYSHHPCFEGDEG